MPKYYCDYCEVQLTHDSPSVRKTHNAGWKHKAAVKDWFQQYDVDVIQSLIDQKVKEYEERMGTEFFSSIFIRLFTCSFSCRRHSCNSVCTCSRPQRA